MNIGKLCLFTDEGKMHQVKVLDLPHGKFRDKGIPIDNVSNYSSSEEQIVMICELLRGSGCETVWKKDDGR